MEDDYSVSQGKELPCMESRPGCTPQLVHGKQAKDGPRCECVCQFSLYCKKHMHACTTAQGAKGHKIYQYWKWQMLPFTSMVKTASCDGMQPTRLDRTTSHLVPHLGGVAASIGTLNRAGAYTLARACASALQTSLSTNMLTQQAFEPLVNHGLF